MPRFTVIPNPLGRTYGGGYTIQDSKTPDGLDPKDYLPHPMAGKDHKPGSLLGWYASRARAEQTCAIKNQTNDRFAWLGADENPASRESGEPESTQAGSPGVTDTQPARDQRGRPLKVAADGVASDTLVDPSGGAQSTATEPELGVAARKDVRGMEVLEVPAPKSESSRDRTMNREAGVALGECAAGTQARPTPSFSTHTDGTAAVSIPGATDGADLSILARPPTPADLVELNKIINQNRGGA